MAMKVQIELKQRGYYSGPIDGKIGAVAKAALRAFQRDQGLTQTGVMDNGTLAKLGISG